jgi:hypothetical protein
MTGGYSRWWLAGAAALMAVAVLWSGSQAQDQKKADDAAVARTRKQVTMLDDLYKTAIVLITENYVDESSDLAAGSAFQKLFDAMRQKKYHDVRLLDATGDPYDADNAPKDDFEKAAIKALKEGKPYYEQVTEQDGKPVLRAATAIPVVLQKCTLCHPAYEKAKQGEAIGALSYTLGIE